MRNTAGFVTAALCAAGVVAAQNPSGVRVEQGADGVRVSIDDQLLTVYRHQGFSRPILYPLHGPGGTVVVRHWPMRDDVEGEQRDHVHQRSLWFAHGDVNGVDFWSEGAAAGRIEHVAFDRTEVVEDTGIIAARNRWLAADGSEVCRDRRVLRFRPVDGAVEIDYDVTLETSAGPLQFGDTKEGTMAIRLAKELRLRGPAAGGRCITSRGHADASAWGKRAEWVDYWGAVDGHVVGVALMAHPDNHAHPTWWHARDYGLLAANPFGAHDFEGAPPGTGALRLAPGERLTLRYRFVLHRGDAVDAGIAARYERYAAVTRMLERRWEFDGPARLAQWRLSDDAAWRVRDGSLELHAASSYSPPVRSPRALALADVRVGDFELDVVAQQTGREYPHRDLCIVFGVQSPSRYYYAHLASAADAHAHNVFLVDGADRRAIGTAHTDGVDWGAGWHRVRLRRSVTDGRIEVYFDDMQRPVITATDHTFADGALGVGSFDDTGRFKDIVLRAPRLEEAPAPRFRAPPNVVLIMADDLGYAELGCYGQERIATPHIDRLAAQGMRFTQAYSGAPVCAPARCVLLTGRHSGHATIRDNFEHKPEGQKPIRDADVTLAEVLAPAGYASGAFGKWGLGYPGSEGDPLAQGFDRFYGYNCQRHAHNFYPRYLWSDAEQVRLAGNDRGVTGAQYSHDLIEAEALEFIRAHAERPFFCYVPFTIPHLALQVPEASLAEYAGRWPETPYEGRSYLPHPTPKAAYAAMVSHMDRSVGRLMELLDELELADNTLVVFTSDNGVTHLKGQVDYEFFQSSGPLRGLKGSVYEGGIRVPLIARWPGVIEAGAETDHVCGFQDVMPTLADVAGVPLQGECDGISLLPTLTGGEGQGQHDYLIWDFPGYGGQLAVRKGRYKAVRRNLRKEPDAPLELYDLQNDIGEQQDLAAELPEVAAELARLMRVGRTEPMHERFRFGEYGDR